MLLSLHLQTDARSTRQLDTSTCSISKSTVQNPTGFLRIGWIFLPAGLISHPFWMKILIECQVYSKWSTQGAGLYNKLYRLQYGHLVSSDSLTLPCGHKIMLFVHYYSLWNEYSFFFDCSQLNFCFVFFIFGVCLGCIGYHYCKESTHTIQQSSWTNPRLARHFTGLWL